MLTISTVHGENATVWNVVDDDQTIIASFNSKGGYTRADAEKVINENRAGKATKFVSWCQPCVFDAEHRKVRFNVLTGYSLRSLPCDNCGHTRDLAMVEVA